MTEKIKRFDSAAAMVASIAGSPYQNTRSAWAGEPLNTFLPYLQRGASDYETRPARELFDKVDAGMHRDRPQWEPNPCGAFAVVPEYLAGSPVSMRQEAREENDAAPVRVFVECAYSDGTSQDAITRRGAACAALTAKLGETRPVELWAFFACKAGGLTGAYLWPLDCHPVSLAQCVATMARKEVCRRVGFALHSNAVGGDICNGHIGWAWGSPSPTRDNILREKLGLNPHDILIQGGYLRDEALMYRDPVAWVHKQIEAQREIE